MLIKFDAAYYKRFYEDPKTRATSAKEQRTQAQFMVAYLHYLDIDVHSILDIGCGFGRLLTYVGKGFPDAELYGVEYSNYLCERFDWRHGSVVDLEHPPCDFVICTDVLGYLDERACAKAIKNLAKLTKSALYMSALTREDLPMCDQDHTDMRQHTRPYSWYRQHLDKHFVGVGGGLFLKKPINASIWRLERI